MGLAGCTSYPPEVGRLGCSFTARNIKPHKFVLCYATPRFFHWCVQINLIVATNGNWYYFIKNHQKKVHPGSSLLCYLKLLEVIESCTRQLAKELKKIIWGILISIYYSSAA